MHVIFLVHGMGSHEADKWAKGVQDAFKAVYPAEDFGNGQTTFS
jgi:hypothetical protein